MRLSKKLLTIYTAPLLGLRIIDLKQEKICATIEWELMNEV